MIKRITFFFLFISIALIGKAQNESFLTSQEKAYLYHIVMKSSTLNRNLSHAFEYNGLVDEKEPDNYLFIEEQILKDPTTLRIYFDEFKSQSSGVIAELANKMALWTLYNELKEGITIKKEEDYPANFQQFLDTLVKKCPKQFLMVDRDLNEIFPRKHFDLLNPNLTYNERKEMISKLDGLESNQEKQLMDAIHETIKDYTTRKSKDVYRMLGMDGVISENFLLAAGDGSGTSGLLGEVEKDNKDEKGVAKGVGLFTYETYIEAIKDKQVLFPEKEPKVSVSTIGERKKTNVHLSMWGFNYLTQTTVVVTKGEKSYLFYGSKYTGELSPDPRYNNDEKTYKTHLKKLEEEEVPEQEKEVYGEGGFEAKWEQLKLDRKKLINEIEKNEYKESMLRMDQRKNKSKIKKLGNKLDAQHQKLWALEKRIAEAKEEFEEEKLKLDKMKFRLSKMKRNLGNFEQKFWPINHLVYQFEDGTIFNVKTQDLIFEANEEPEQFDIQLLAVGSNPMSEYADEVQLNIAVTEVNDKEELIQEVELVLVDAFSSDGYTLKKLSFSPEADYLFSKMVKHSIDESISLDLKLTGNGIGEYKGGKISPRENQKDQLKAYPGETTEEREEAKQLNKFKELRVTTGGIKFTNKKFTITLNSYTDPVKSNVARKSGYLGSFIKQHPELTENELLSGLRTFGVLDQLIKKMKSVSDEHLKKDLEKQKKYQKYFDHQRDIAPVMIGDFRLTYDVFKQSL